MGGANSKKKGRAAFAAAEVAAAECDRWETVASFTPTSMMGDHRLRAHRAISDLDSLIRANGEDSGEDSDEDEWDEDTPLGKAAEDEAKADSVETVLPDPKRRRTEDSSPASLSTSR